MSEDVTQADVDLARDICARVEHTLGRAYYDTEIRHLVARHRLAAAKAMQERIAAWLRDFAEKDRYGPRWRPLHYAASAIERGEHRTLNQEETP